MSLCQECGALLDEGRRCSDYFSDLLALEWEVPGGPGGRAHFLAVAAYNLQHPSLLTREILTQLAATLSDVLAERATVADALARARATTDGPTRVRRRPGDPDHELAAWPTRWEVTVRDVCGVPPSSYLQQVHAWATSVDASLSAHPGGK